jgi:aminopeptidase
MRDPRFKKLAELLVSHSTKLTPSDRILLDLTHVPTGMICELVEAATARGALPIVETRDLQVHAAWLKTGTPEQIAARTELLGKLELARMEQMTAYIAIRGSNNITEMSDVPAAHMGFYEKNVGTPVHSERRCKHTKWCVLRWPTSSMAQQAGMSTEAFENFYFEVCMADYAAMEQAAKPLQELMNKTDRVKILGRNTDLEFSIKDIKAVPCTGNYNIPDGECFTAPVRDSVNGRIHFNSPTLYRGNAFDDICLTFENGRVTDFTSSNNDALRSILDSDEGARYIGEFALGFHPFIRKPMRDILFDEKIRGSLHLALGQCYEETENGNRSQIHWDLVLRQEEGGEIHFDGQQIRKDGRFVLPELQGLNPENLGGTVE